MKSCAEDHGRYTCFLEQHPKSDGQIEDKAEPVDDQKVNLFSRQKYSTREHFPHKYTCQPENNSILILQRCNFRSLEYVILPIAQFLSSFRIMRMSLT